MITIRALARHINEIDPDHKYSWSIIDEDGQLCLQVTKIRYQVGELDEVTKTVRTAYSNGLLSQSKKKLREIVEELEK